MKLLTHKYPTNFSTSNCDHGGSKEKEKHLSKTTVIDPYNSGSPLKLVTTTDLRGTIRLVEQDCNSKPQTGLIMCQNSKEKSSITLRRTRV